jgi:hypothetical protein
LAVAFCFVALVLDGVGFAQRGTLGSSTSYCTHWRGILSHHLSPIQRRHVELLIARVCSGHR